MAPDGTGEHCSPTPVAARLRLQGSSACASALFVGATRTGVTLPGRGVRSVTRIPIGRTAAVQSPQFEASFPADRSAISPVRRRVRACLEAAGLGCVAEDVALICQELLANAVLHGCEDPLRESTVWITVDWSDTRLRLSVRDPSDRPPAKQEFSATRTCGRGLNLVDTLCDRWGVETGPAGTGKAVWTELDSSRWRSR
ncbi:ATP-binding protein [Streptomyces griseoviridis]|uniref:ATP-binding protein n=1 Tax=Streptomyces griseoviridis TaxID=45398 RepID=UPI00344BCDFA